ncbi:TetR/AcrR family transcriptional regulator [Sphingomonas sp. SUN039]|uniref:TetR/AcrR family transcriptional regulator n=1 Tax=Sphingomonas sp. SUN039 TaxID=2937787 RepID=UPI002164C171|nr:TetR/AcrR family transcriptional regulator [Sphingomonas sp. SUN039]UVO55186.1 TetR/AcrR family transcriptional regulator [Sphingomonas sp. SUN039]
MSSEAALAEAPPSAHDELRDAKRAAIVATARAAFFAQGYGATSMSSIAATVGGSKTTLWSHFRSKEELFAAVVDDIVERYGTALSIELPPGAPVAPTLEIFASALMATILSAPIIDLHRVVTGEAGRFPELAALFWERGPKRGKARLAAYFAAAMADGRLRAGDPMRAALQFVALCQAESFQPVILAMGPAPDAETIAREVTVAVESFLKIWAERAEH